MLSYLAAGLASLLAVAVTVWGWHEWLCGYEAARISRAPRTFQNGVFWRRIVSASLITH